MQSRNRDGYGKVKRDNKELRANRVAYELANGVDLGDLIVRHTCDNPPCCNPKHLIPGTHKDNAIDRDTRDRRFGGSVGHSKLTAEQVVEIYQSADSLTYLACKFNVNDATIRDIMEGRTWQMVTSGLEPRKKPDGRHVRQVTLLTALIGIAPPTASPVDG